MTQTWTLVWYPRTKQHRYCWSPPNRNLNCMYPNKECKIQKNGTVKVLTIKNELLYFFVDTKYRSTGNSDNSKSYYKISPKRTIRHSSLPLKHHHSACAKAHCILFIQRCMVSITDWKTYTKDVFPRYPQCRSPQSGPFNIKNAKTYQKPTKIQGILST